MAPVTAIFENGVFRPTGKVDLPERCVVEFTPEVIEERPKGPMDGIYAVLGLRFRSGEHDVAERHNEHQP